MFCCNFCILFTADYFILTDSQFFSFSGFDTIIVAVFNNSGCTIGSFDFLSSFCTSLLICWINEFFHECILVCRYHYCGGMVTVVWGCIIGRYALDLLLLARSSRNLSTFLSEKNYIVRACMLILVESFSSLCLWSFCFCTIFLKESDDYNIMYSEFPSYTCQRSYCINTLN